MLPLDHPDRTQFAFDDHRLVANPESTERGGGGGGTGIRDMEERLSR